MFFVVFLAAQVSPVVPPACPRRSALAVLLAPVAAALVAATPQAQAAGKKELSRSQLLAQQ